MMKMLGFVRVIPTCTWGTGRENKPVSSVPETVLTAPAEAPG